MTVNAFLQVPIKRLAEDYRIYVVCNGKTQDIAERVRPYLTVLPVAIRRRISLIGDLAALWHLTRVVSKYKFDVIHSVTPKAGLLAVLAGYMAGTKMVIHTFTGQVWATRKGLGRLLLKSMDRVIASLASRTLADSPSQLQFLLDENVVSKSKSCVLGKGSISGVDITRFRPDADARAAVRQGLGIPHEATVFLFLGRLNRDKGVLDLAAAFTRVARTHSGVHLLIVGPDEGNLTPAMVELTGAYAGRAHFVAHTDSPEAYMAASDVFCLPSYREGFGSVIIEAAAAGLPAIGSRIYGIVDAIEEGRTGLLHKAGDVAELQGCMSKLAASGELVSGLGRNARVRAVADFSSDALADAWVSYYRGLK
jgi:glycosyltransferase involved in cell wall biosynthesis